MRFFHVLAAFSMITLCGCIVADGERHFLLETQTLQEVQERANQAPYENPLSVTVLSESEIRQTIIGSTLVGPSTYYGPEITEYFLPDGSIKAHFRSDDSEGLWAISRSLICIYYPFRLGYPPRSTSIYHCFTLAIDGDIVTYYDQNGRPIKMKSILLSGNARDL